MKWLPHRNLRLVLVALLFGVVAVLAAVTDPRISRVPPPSVDLTRDFGGAARPSHLEPPRTPVADDAAGAGIPDAVAVVLAGLAFLALLGLLLVLLWRAVQDQMTLRHTGPSTKPRKTALGTEPIRAAVAAGLDELDIDGADPRAAVIACWLRLEQAAAAAGTPRVPSDSPGDLVARMLAAHQVSGQVLDRLAQVYRQARYAPHEIGEATRDEARAALRRLHAELAAASRRLPVGAVTDEPG